MDMNDDLRRRVLEALERHDGVCLDNDEERERLAEALVAELTALPFPDQVRDAPTGARQLRNHQRR